MRPATGRTRVVGADTGRRVAAPPPGRLSIGRRTSAARPGQRLHGASTLPRVGDARPDRWRRAARRMQRDVVLGVHERRGSARFSTPTPCSPVIEPPSAMHSRRISAAQRLGAIERARLAAVEQDQRVQVAVAGVEDVGDADAVLASPCASISASASPSRRARDHAVLDDEVGRQPARPPRTRSCGPSRSARRSAVARAIAHVWSRPTRAISASRSRLARRRPRARPRARRCSTAAASADSPA